MRQRAQDEAATAAPRPKLVVLLVVDQMRGDYVDHFHAQWTGGLARLVNQGAWFQKAAYPYLTTVTCAGHATISTGQLPDAHGIVANAWFDRATGKMVTCTADPKSSDLSYNGESHDGDSATRLETRSFADELREQTNGKTRVVSFSIKARAAIMLAGHKADAIAWHDDKTGLLGYLFRLPRRPIHRRTIPRPILWPRTMERFGSRTRGEVFL